MNDFATVALSGLAIFLAFLGISLIMFFITWVCKEEKRKSIALFIVFAYVLCGIVYALGNMVFSKSEKVPDWKQDQLEEQHNRRFN